jgi:hypothetical protein
MTSFTISPFSSSPRLASDVLHLFSHAALPRLSCSFQHLEPILGMNLLERRSFSQLTLDRLFDLSPW